jgi:hypothetical protein
MTEQHATYVLINQMTRAKNLVSYKSNDEG